MVERENRKGRAQDVWMNWSILIQGRGLGDEDEEERGIGVRGLA